MSYVSLIFFVFIAFVSILYFAMPMDKRWIVLLIASIVFYLSFTPAMLPFMLLMSAIAWQTGLKIEKIYNENLPEDITPKEKRAEIAKRRPRARVILKCVLVFAIGALAFFKFARKLPFGFAGSIIVPLGISYYTFSIIAYIVDIYYAKISAEKNYFKFTLFVSYFPKIVEGPIARYNKMSDLFEGHAFDYDRVCKGIQLMMWGIIKKLIIVERLLPQINRLYSNVSEYSGSTLAFMAFWVLVESYADFSGCMDIGLGVSQIFGIDLERNFRRPFFSQSASEFWRRWHMSLGVFMKDYVYMPIVSSSWLSKMMQFARKKIGPRAGKVVMQTVPTIVVWLLTGLWHGTGSTYIFWGVYWGGIMCFSTLMEPCYKKFYEKTGIDQKSKGVMVFRILRTWLLFIIGRLLTVPNSLIETAKVFYRILFKFGAGNFGNEMVKLGASFSTIGVVTIFTILFFMVSLLEEIKGTSVRDMISTLPVAVRWIILYGMFFAILILGIYGSGYEVNNFGYANF